MYRVIISQIRSRRRRHNGPYSCHFLRIREHLHYECLRDRPGSRRNRDRISGQRKRPARRPKPPGRRGLGQTGSVTVGPRVGRARKLRPRGPDGCGARHRPGRGSRSRRARIAAPGSRSRARRAAAPPARHPRGLHDIRRTRGLARSPTNGKAVRLIRTAQRNGAHTEGHPNSRRRPAEPCAWLTAAAAAGHAANSLSRSHAGAPRRGRIGRGVSPELPRALQFSSAPGRPKRLPAARAARRRSQPLGAGPLGARRSAGPMGLVGAVLTEKGA